MEKECSFAFIDHDINDAGNVATTLVVNDLDLVCTDDPNVARGLEHTADIINAMKSENDELREFEQNVKKEFQNVFDSCATVRYNAGSDVISKHIVNRIEELFKIVGERLGFDIDKEYLNREDDV